MAWNPNIKKGVDLPVWDWLSFAPVASNPGAGCAYDGSRYIYFLIQSGSTTANSTEGLYRFDTWTEGWQFLATATSGFAGADIEYDAVRNVIYVINGGTAGTTTCQVFNLNLTAVTIANNNCNPFVFTTMSQALPGASVAGSSLSMPDDLSSIGALSANGATAIDSGTSTAASTTTSIVDGSATSGSFGFGLVGLYVRFTSGAQSGNRRLITAVPSPTTLTVSAFGGAPGAGDTFVVEVPEGTATSATASTLVDSGQAWTTNLYRDADVVIISGAGSGQRRRIGSHTGTTITLAAAVTGNARTGNWSVTPDATSVYRIVPSSDFLYYQVGGATTIYRLDVVQTTGAAWSASLAALPGATGGGANTFYPGLYDPFAIIALRGAATATLYRFQIGTLAWTTITTFPGGETFTTGATSAMIHGRRRLFVQKESSQRTVMINLTTGAFEPGPYVPYAGPSAYEGKRAKYVKTADGVEWLYILRAGGQEFFRVPLEWLV